MDALTSKIPGLNLGLLEAQLLGLEFHAVHRVAWATFKVYTLPEKGPVPDDRRVNMLFGPVGRVGAALWRRESADARGALVQLRLEDLLAIVDELSKPSITSEVFDLGDEAAPAAVAGASARWSQGTDGLSHTITLRARRQRVALDLRIWFDQIEVRKPSGEVVPIDELIAGAQRWAAGLNAGDERTKGFGMGVGTPTGWDVPCPRCGATIHFPRDLSQIERVRCPTCGQELVKQKDG